MLPCAEQHQVPPIVLFASSSPASAKNVRSFEYVNGSARHKHCIFALIRTEAWVNCSGCAGIQSVYELWRSMGTGDIRLLVCMLPCPCENCRTCIRSELQCTLTSFIGPPKLKRMYIMNKRPDSSVLLTTDE